MARTSNPGDMELIDSGDLGAARRTIGGLLGQLDGLEIPPQQIIAILMDAGLPARAAEDPSFPISIEQDFRILDGMRAHFNPNRSLTVGLFEMLSDLSIQVFGLFGLALQSAPSILAAFQIPLQYPQLNWGRSRMMLRRSAQIDQIVLELPRSRIDKIASNDPDQVFTYALLLDLVGTVGIVRDIVETPQLLNRVTIPFERPHDWSDVSSLLDYDVQFDAPQAGIEFSPRFFESEPKHAHALTHKATMNIVRREAAMLADDKTMSDRVSRWLWAYTPPLKKPEIADLLAVSVRSLTRDLAREGTRYNQLLADVQSERAANLLANDNLSVSEVAYRLGYADTAAFSRAFVTWKGVSPSAWRSDLATAPARS